MSHEIRTPLNAIIGFINLCFKTPLTSEQRDYLDKSKTASETLLSLINQTLDYSKIESGKFEIDTSEFEVATLLKKVHALFFTQAYDKGVNFDVSVAKTLPSTLVGDSLRIEQVLINLIGNALKFTDHGKVVLTVGMNVHDSEHVECQFVITDTGIGIPERVQSKLFESFQQADNSTTRKYGGTGLGLTISKKIVEMMGGTIQLHSKLNEGSEFRVNLTLPLAKSSVMLSSDEIIRSFDVSTIADDTEVPASLEITNVDEQEQVLKHRPAKLNGIKILLVEDIEVNRVLASALLKEHGAIVVTVNDGKEAIEELAINKDYDVILMDIQMPNMDGYEATQIIRSDDSINHIKILAMTANVLQSDINKCHDAGMNGHIPKPIEESEMVEKILQEL